jgi:hypothetical protein
MANFLLIYYKGYDLKAGRPSPQQLQNSISEWRRWHNMLSIQNRKTMPLKLWAPDGVSVCSLTADTDTYVEVRESLGGLIFLQAADYAAAVEIARQCPILQLGGNIEVRMTCILEEKI